MDNKVDEKERRERALEGENFVVRGSNLSFEPMKEEGKVGSIDRDRYMTPEAEKKLGEFKEKHRLDLQGFGKDIIRLAA